MFNISKIFEKFNIAPLRTLLNKKRLENERDIQARFAQIIINATDPEELKNKIVRETAIALNAYRCFFIEYDSTTHNFRKVTNAYNAERNAKNLLGYDLENNIPRLAMNKKYMKTVVIADTKKFIKKSNLEGTKEDNYFKEYNVKASLSVRLEFGETFLGVLIVHYDWGRTFNEDFVMKFLKNIAEHISIALYLSKLYIEEKNEKEKEQLLRSIISIMSKDYNLAQVTKKMFNILNKIYNVQTVFITTDIEGFENSYFYNLSEHSADNIESINENDLTNIYSLREFDLIKNKKYYIPDTHNFVIQSNLENGPIEIFFQKNGIKSLILLPILYENFPLGLVAMHFNAKNQIAKDDLEFIKTITEQLAIAIKQTNNYEKQKQTAEREALFRNIIETIRSTLEISEIKKTIVETIGKALKADRCFITEYDEAKNMYKQIKDEYLASEEISSCKLTNVNKEAPVFAKILKEGKEILVQDRKIYLGTSGQNFKVENETIEKNGVNSLFAVPLFYKKDFLGVLTIQYLKEGHKIGEFEINLLKDIANQTALAIHQAKLYKLTQEKAKKEKLLGDIVLKAISTFDINQIKHLVNEVGIITKADRCYFVEVDLDGLQGKPIDYDGEYLASPDIKTIIGYQFLAEDVKKFVELYLEKRDLVVFDYEKLREDKNEAYRGINNYSRQFDLKSGIGIPFIYMNKLIAVLCIEYVKEKILPSPEELDFLRILGNQTGMAFNQIQLYQDTKRIAEREIVLRKIIETVRSTLDITRMKKQIVTAIGELFNVERCIIHQIDESTGKFMVIDEASEYKSLDDLVSYAGIDIEQPELEFFKNLFASAKEMIAPNFSEYLKSLKDVSRETKDWIMSLDIKSDYVFPIIFQNKLIATFYMTYTKEYRTLSDDELNSIRVLTNQIGIALNQASSYKKVQKLAVSEQLTREIISEISSSLDLNKIKKALVTKTGAALGSDFDILYIQDQATKKFIPIDGNCIHLSSDEIENPIGLNIIEDYDWGDFFRNNDMLSLAYSDTEDFKKDYSLYGTDGEKFLDRFKLKSFIITPIKYSGILYGLLGINFTQQHKNITDDDINLVKTVAIQAGIALHQAELYKTTQAQAETEKFNRKILEILRNTLDKKTIKHLFVKSIGQYFKADRVFFSEYDAKSNMYMPVEEGAEYLSNSKEKSFVGYDWSGASSYEYIQPLLEKRELTISCWEDYIKNNPKSKDFISLFEDADVRSSYNFPVMYEGSLMGYFCIEFTQNDCKQLNEEEINRIRSMCTQAGIALYHAELFLKAQKTSNIKDEFIINIASGARAMLQNIMELSEEMATTEVKCDKHIEFLNKINLIVEKLLNFTNSLVESTNKNERT